MHNLEIIKNKLDIYNSKYKNVDNIHSMKIDKKYKLDSLDINKKKQLINEIISETDIDNILIKHEFYNLVYNEKIHDKENLMSIILEDLKRYHTVIGGEYLDDDEWCILRPTDINKFDVDDFDIKEQIKKNIKADMYILYNTINNIYIEMINEYIKNMKTHIEKYSAYKINEVFINDKNNELIWILLTIN